jgi:hypothetical protein
MLLLPRYERCTDASHIKLIGHETEVAQPLPIIKAATSLWV